MDSLEEMAVKLSITGFSDQIFTFAEKYLDFLIECANEDGFNKKTVIQSVNKIKQEYANNNTEVDERATHNRLLMLIPHTFHDKLM